MVTMPAMAAGTVVGRTEVATSFAIAAGATATTMTAASGVSEGSIATVMVTSIAGMCGLAVAYDGTRAGIDNTRIDVCLTLPETHS